MSKFIAEKDFKFQPDFKSGVISVKKGQRVEICNSKDFPDLEDKMIRFNYVRRSKENIEENI